MVVEPRLVHVLHGEFAVAALKPQGQGVVLGVGERSPRRIRRGRIEAPTRSAPGTRWRGSPRRIRRGRIEATDRTKLPAGLPRSPRRIRRGRIEAEPVKGSLPIE